MRTTHPGKWILAMVGGWVLAAPAAAHAGQTWSVDPGHPGCAASGAQCRTLAEAAARAQSGDTISLAAARYAESVEIAQPNVTLSAAPGTQIVGDPAAAEGTPVLEFSAAGADAAAASAVRGAVIVSTTAKAPGILVSGTAGLVVEDVIGLSSAGSLVRIVASAHNRIVRSALFHTAAGGTAVEVESAGGDPAAKALVVESSVLSGGAAGTGLAARSLAGAVNSSAGDITVALRHATVAGAGNALVADASAANGAVLPAPDAAGNIAVTATDSIVHGGRIATAHAGGTLSTANSATIDVATRNDLGTAADRLFAAPAKRDYRLRADAPVIDQGALTPGESATDLQGQARTAGSAPDLGADEFHNRAPSASLQASDPSPREGATVTFDASGSGDPEQAIGGGITAYRWDFGDGSTATTTTPRTTHAYTRRGSYAATVTTVDAQGAGTAAAAIPVVVRDGVAPQVAITFPASKAKLKRATVRVKRVAARKGRKRVTRKRVLRPVRMTFGGMVADDSGVRSVDLALVLVKRAGTTRPRRSASRRARTSPRAILSAAQRCLWFDGSRGFRRRSCDRPRWFAARLDGQAWSFRVPDSRRLPAGEYVLAARGTDGTGLTGATGGRPLVAFTVG